MRNVEREVISLVAKQFKKVPEEIALDDRILKELGGDSVDTIELVIAFENAFDIVIKQKDIRKFSTPRQAIAFIKKEV